VARAFNPATPARWLQEILPDLDLALVMSVRPGFGGQDFLPGSLERIAAVRRQLDARGLAAELEVDGGVKPANCRAVRDAGATVLVAGSAVYLDPAGPAAAIRRLREALR